MKKVMLLGDSIRMSYQPLVAQRLEGQAQVWGPAENCQFSLYTLSALPRWLGEFQSPDVVHWNNGIHDVGHNPNRAPVQMPLEVYRANVQFILAQLQAARARVIWATSTPVHPQRPRREDQWSWCNQEIDAYNAAALEVMAEHDITVNDLHGLVAADPDRYLSEDQLHLSEAGQERCAEAVAGAVAECL
ncbi:SGNH/GDSL hydrolase family protein [Candidatus Latescibacterota bacterium]